MTKLNLESLGGLKIYTPQDIEFLKMLIYGESGTGKSHLAGTIAMVPECQPVLVFDIEGGSTTLRKLKLPNLEIVKPSDFKEAFAVKEELKKLSKIGGLPYRTIIVDSATELQRLGTDNVMVRTVTKAKEKGEDKDPDHPDWGDWSKSHNQFRRFIRELRDLNCNVIITALAKIDDEIPSRIKAEPLLNGIMSEEVPATFDVVLYLYSKPNKQNPEEVLRYAQSLKTEYIIAKDRTGNLDPYIEMPNLKELYPKLIEIGE